MLASFTFQSSFPIDSSGPIASVHVWCCSGSLNEFGWGFQELISTRFVGRLAPGTCKHQESKQTKTQLALSSNMSSSLPSNANFHHDIRSCERFPLGCANINANSSFCAPWGDVVRPSLTAPKFSWVTWSILPSALLYLAVYLLTKSFFVLYSRLTKPISIPSKPSHSSILAYFKTNPPSPPSPYNTQRTLPLRELHHEIGNLEPTIFKTYVVSRDEPR